MATTRNYHPLYSCVVLLLFAAFTSVIAEVNATDAIPTPSAPPEPPPPPPCPRSCNCSGGPDLILCLGDSNMERLSFRGFGITNVPVFVGLYDDLTLIDLGDNLIQHIPTRAFDQMFLPVLEDIVLSNNLISELQPNAFDGPFQIIILAINELGTFSTAPFHVSGEQFETLDLSNNLIDSFEFTRPFDETVYPNLQIFLQDNLIPCDRDDPLQAPFAPLCADFIIPSESTAMCYTPDDDEVIQLTEFCSLIDDAAATEPTSGPPPCPRSCDCSGVPDVVRCLGDSQIEKLSFRGWGLTRVPVFNGLYDRLKEIDLGDNLIDRVPTRAFDRILLPNVEEILLDDNLISDLGADAFDGPLQSINLSDNLLETFSTSPYRIPPGVFETLDLSNNLIDGFEFTRPFDRMVYPDLQLFLHDNLISCDPEDPLQAPFAPLCTYFIIPSESTAMCINIADFSGDHISLSDFCFLIDSIERFGATDLLSGTTTDATNEPSPASSASLGVTIGVSVGVLAVVIVVVVALIFVVLCWRLKTWERKFDDVTVAQVETTLRLRRACAFNAQLEAGRSSTSSSSYARYTPAPAPPPPDYKAGLVPGGPTPTFFPTPEEDTYASVDTRPLPTIPAKTVEESDYEDGYILQVDSIPARNELPGIMIAKRRERLASIQNESTLKSKSQPAPEPIPTESDSEEENATTTKVVPAYQLDVHVEDKPGQDDSPEPSAPPEEYLEPISVLAHHLETLESEKVDSMKEPKEAVREIEGVRVEEQTGGKDIVQNEQELYLPIVH